MFSFPTVDRKAQAKINTSFNEAMRVQETINTSVSAKLEALYARANAQESIIRLQQEALESMATEIKALRFPLQ